MKNKDLQYLKKILEDRLHALIHQVDHTVVNMMDSDTSAADLVDRAAIESEREYELRIRGRESRLIRKIKRSLEDIEAGTYGICESCGEDISVERLKARPVTRHCIECKRKLEAYEKVAGF